MNDIDRPITERERELYRDGHYAFDPCYICGNTDLWDEDDWIRYVRACGRWTR